MGWGTVLVSHWSIYQSEVQCARYVQREAIKHALSLPDRAYCNCEAPDDQRFLARREATIATGFCSPGCVDLASSVRETA
jgi:hypothetical protein